MLILVACNFFSSKVINFATRALMAQPGGLTSMCVCHINKNKNRPMV